MYQYNTSPFGLSSPYPLDNLLQAQLLQLKLKPTFIEPASIHQLGGFESYYGPRVNLLSRLQTDGLGLALLGAKQISLPMQPVVRESYLWPQGPTPNPAVYFNEAIMKRKELLHFPTISELKQESGSTGTVDEAKPTASEGTEVEKKTPKCSNSKKIRRSASKITRSFKCPFQGCPKAYGHCNSLKTHYKLKHEWVIQAMNKKAIKAI